MLKFAACVYWRLEQTAPFNAELLVEGFRRYPAQRSALLDDIMGSVVPNLPMGKRTQREFLIGDTSQLRIQMVSALMLQLVQVYPSHSSICRTPCEMPYTNSLVPCRQNIYSSSMIV